MIAGGFYFGMHMMIDSIHAGVLTSVITGCFGLGVSLLNRRNLHELHISVNSRLTELLITSGLAQHSSGRREGIESEQQRLDEHQNAIIIGAATAAAVVVKTAAAQAAAVQAAAAAAATAPPLIDVPGQPGALTGTVTGTVSGKVSGKVSGQ